MLKTFDEVKTMTSIVQMLRSAGGQLNLRSSRILNETIESCKAKGDARATEIKPTNIWQNMTSFILVCLRNLSVVMKRRSFETNPG